MVTHLDQLTIGQHAIVRRLDLEMLGIEGERRLRAMGINEGVPVEALHQGVMLSRDPIAVKVGRMTLAIRRAQAAGIEIEPA